MGNIKRNVVMIVIVIVCLSLATVLTLMTLPGRRTKDPLKAYKGKKIWVKCKNEACGAEYQVNQKFYFEYIKDNIEPMSTEAPPLICEKCLQKTVYRAVKCPKCGKVFFYDIKSKDFPDRCPECNFSETEETRKKARPSE